MDWAIHRCHGPVQELHAMEPPATRRSVWTLAGDDDAVVVGSTQSLDIVDRDRCARAGIDVVRRHSGGGAVLLLAGDYRWVDVVVPVGDPLWVADVSRSFEWLGDLWLTVLSPYVDPLVAHRGPTAYRDEGRVCCFAGWSHGEIMSGDRKVLGMSQRRTRDFARFQCVFYADHRADQLGDLLTSAVVTPGVVERLGHVATVSQPDAVVDAFLAQLP